LENKVIIVRKNIFLESYSVFLSRFFLL